MSDLTQIGADAAEQSQTNTNEEFERFDLSGVQFGMQHPTTAVRGDPVALRAMYDEDNPDRSPESIIIDDATLVTDGDLSDTVVAQSDDESDQFKVVDLSDRQTGVLTPTGKESDVHLTSQSVFRLNDTMVEADTAEAVARDNGLVNETEDGEEEVVTESIETVADDDTNVIVMEDGEIDDALGISSLTGVDFAGNSYFGDISQTFPEDRLCVKRGGGAGQRIAKCLDVNGADDAEAITDDDGFPELHEGGHPKVTEGLYEQTPDRIDKRPRRGPNQPELRPDIAGDVVVMIQRLDEVDPEYSGRAYWATVFAEVGDDRQQELAEQYANAGDDVEPEDFVTTLDGDEFIRLDPTDEFERSEGNDVWVDYAENKIDYDEPSHIAWLNERRSEMDLDPYIPEDMDQSTVEEAEPSDAEADNGSGLDFSHLGDDE